MRINPLSSPMAASVSAAARPIGEAAEMPAVSRLARDLIVARQAFDASPVIREERVAVLRNQIEQGTYSVTPEMVARKLLGP
ncbi:MAG: hypothetical protein C4321_02845 [Chloroflexota bacterium]